ncbi:MAG: type II toxin-antitoxin system death-on-curing family toxin [Mesorhizobium sp.]|nr:MAG: type II toxin-antitoxin system death-on-curing family toxin [Mesorhizobium sp.]RWD38553.1 MAG: type II toxin-antitoxin system death-on-curing family toxin [Mesorhizobium sp.]RWD41946.1 MAG: type II toxin-antitoxin system death-on-curing family toxin [Mesorhizobium sp.]RWD83699.1 MAG: type II toxin-antitoxin system death-on-curing family toxin [Mesorhizobium sp.]RWF57494.1 MAG: type II toxin-antitoxin system death-on-curing family toxin [Mesorhizobium sp.]
MLLESALYRPREIYGEPDLCELASACLFGIAKNHPFVDGNKRTTFAAADPFLYFNGLSIEAGQADIIQLVMMVAASEIDEAGAAAFFRDHVVKVEA